MAKVTGKKYKQQEAKLPEIVAKLKQKGYPNLEGLSLENLKDEDWSLGKYLGLNITHRFGQKLKSRIALAIMIEKIKNIKGEKKITDDQILEYLNIRVSKEQNFISQLTTGLTRTVDWQSVLTLEKSEWWQSILEGVSEKSKIELFRDLQAARAELAIARDTIRQRDMKINEIRANLREALKEIETLKIDKEELQRQNQELVKRLLQV